MPIKGLTDRGLSFPEIGQIRKGAPKEITEQERTRPGKDLNYFRITLDANETQAAEILKKRFGEHPTEINILLPFNEIERNWEAWLEAYSAGQMIARSDGETYLYRVDPKTGEVLTKAGRVIPYVEGEVLYKTPKTEVKCRPVGRLKVVIPELQRLVYLTVLTTSINDIRNISGQLEALYQLTGGRIAGVPLVLRRRPKMISTPGTNGRARREKWLISIEADPVWVKAKLMEVKKLALPGNGLALLPAPEQAEPEHEEQPEADWEDEDEIEGEIEEPAPEPEAAAVGPTAEEISWAGAMLTPKGKPFSELTDSQLQYLVEHTNGDTKKAASILIEARIEFDKKR